MPQVIPGILEQNFDEIKRRIELVSDLVEWIHIDILDNTLFHNVTYNNWEAFKIFDGRVKLEAHLMVSNPHKYVKPLVDNGFDRLIAHAEGHSIRDFLHEAKMHEVEAGVALDAPSSLELIEPFLGHIDVVLIMGVNAGYSGQSFLPEVLPKIRKIHEEYSELPIVVDGGMNKETASQVSELGATRLVVTSYLFKEPENIEEKIQDLESL